MIPGEHISSSFRERRKKAIEEMIYKLIEFADKDEIYEETSPLLFGDKIAKEAIEREDQLQYLDRASSSQNSYQRNQNFHNCYPQNLPLRGRQEHGLRRPTIWNTRKGMLPSLPQTRNEQRKTHFHLGIPPHPP